MDITEKTDLFEAARPQLLGIAYRLLGSLSEAEDAVQDTAYKWFADEITKPDNPIAWLSAICTNRCLDILKSAQRKRLRYVGPWLPDQFQSETAASAEEQIEVSSSLNTAFLLLLERLSPKERAAYLLHDIFSMSFSEVSTALGISNEGCRQLASRARRMIDAEKVRYVPSREVQEHLLREFRRTLETGDATKLVDALSEEATFRADSGGKVIALREVLSGRTAVATFFSDVLSKAWSGSAIYEIEVNGQMALLIGERSSPVAVMSFSFTDAAEIKDVYVLRNPNKIERLLATSLTVGGLRMHRRQETMSDSNHIR